jgi:2-methylcitrate dehydratase PrpD
METIASRFARFIRDLSFEDLPREVVSKVKVCVFDLIGCALGGMAESADSPLIEYLLHLGGESEATIWGLGKRVPASHAALANGTVAHHLELDDGNRLATAHPGVCIIPSTIALGQKLQANGKELIESIVIGYEVVNRIGKATRIGVQRLGIHGPGSLGTFGAAAASAKMLKLDEQGIVNALGICALTPIAPYEVFTRGGLVKDMYGGWPAFLGVTAASLGQAGLTGPDTIFEGKFGYGNILNPNLDPESIVVGLGSRFEIMDTYFKRYPSSRATHAPIDAALELANTRPINFQELDEIVVRTYGYAAKVASNNSPRDVVAAKTSIPFTVALALRDKEVNARPFSTESLANQPLMNVVKKVRVEVDPEYDQRYPTLRGAKIFVRTKQGVGYEAHTDIPKGDPENPLDSAQLEAKFEDLATKLVSKRRASSIMHEVQNLEKIRNLTSLASLLA